MTKKFHLLEQFEYGSRPLWAAWSMSVILLNLLCPPSVQAVVLDPTPEKISEVMENAKSSLGSPGYLPNQFGDGTSCNWGYIQTKLFNIWIKTRRLKLEYKKYPPSEIRKDLALPELTITFALCTNQPHHRDHTIHLIQGERVTKPAEVWVNFPDIISTRENNAFAYSMTIRASFPYAELDPHGPATIRVIPESGNPLDFPVDLSKFP